MAETTSGALGPRPAEVEITICGDVEMTRLNFDHMGERGPTDVLAFPLHEWTVESGHSHLADEDGRLPDQAPLVLGDVVIDLDQAVRQAAEGDWSVAEEVALLAIYGTLHLLGHDHDDAEGEAAMRDSLLGAPSVRRRTPQSNRPACLEETLSFYAATVRFHVAPANACERRDPYAVARVMGTRQDFSHYAASIDHAVWVPAFAGTTGSNPCRLRAIVHSTSPGMQVRHTSGRIA